MMSSPSTIDKLDRKILEIMQVSNRNTSEHIADKVGLSAATVQRRVKRLRQKHVIIADVSVINPKTLGHNMVFIVQVLLERERADLLHGFKKQMRSNQQIQQCYYVTGSANFLLIVAAIDMEDYKKFVKDTLIDHPNVRNFQANVVVDTVKTGLSWPVGCGR